MNATLDVAPEAVPETPEKTQKTKNVVRQSLGEFGPFLAMRPHGRIVQEKIDARLRALPVGGVLVLDFNGVEMMDYSFADEALGTIYSRMSAKEYPDRHLIIETRDDELCEALLENVEVALNRREVAALIVPQSAKKSADKWRVLGELPSHLVDTLRAVMDKNCITVRDLAEALKLDSATACNNRIAKLYQMHLVRREASVVPEGGRQYCYTSVL